MRKAAFIVWCTTGALFFVLDTALGVPATTAVVPVDPKEVVGKIQKALAPNGALAHYRFVNHRTDKTTSTYEVRFSIGDAVKSHGHFLQPTREKGREVLRLLGELWTFVPSVGRIVRIQDRDSFAGGDF